MRDARLVEESEFRKEHPIYFKDEAGHHVQTSGHIVRTFKGYSFEKVKSHGHGDGH